MKKGPFKQSSNIDVNVKDKPFALSTKNQNKRVRGQTRKEIILQQISLERVEAP